MQGRLRRRAFRRVFRITGMQRDAMHHVNVNASPKCELDLQSLAWQVGARLPDTTGKNRCVGNLIVHACPCRRG